MIPIEVNECTPRLDVSRGTLSQFWCRLACGTRGEKEAEAQPEEQVETDRGDDAEAESYGAADRGRSVSVVVVPIWHQYRRYHDTQAYDRDPCVAHPRSMPLSGAGGRA
jgi:hypothetical protein